MSILGSQPTYLSFLDIGIPASSRLVYRPIYPQVVSTTNDGDYRRDDKRRDDEIRKFRQRKEQLQRDLVAAYNRTFGISLPDETEPAEMVAAIEENMPQIARYDVAEIEKRVLEKLVRQYREYEQSNALYEEIEDETEIMLIAAATLLH